MSTFSNTQIRYGLNEVQVKGIAGEYIFDTINSSSTFYELDLLEQLLMLSSNTDATFIDVGANIGNHTLFFASINDAQVISIEPEYDNFSILCENVKINDLTDKVELHNVAIWDSVTKLDLTNSSLKNSGMFRAHEAPNGTVEGIPLDDLVSNRNIDAIKIDVEGAELRVLKGATAIITEARPHFSIEVHSAKAFKEINSFLASYGYEVVSIAGRSDNYIWCHPTRLNTTIEAARAMLQLRSERSAARKQNHNFDRLSRSSAQTDSKVEKLSSDRGTLDSITSLNDLGKQIYSKLDTLNDNSVSWNNNSVELASSLLRKIDEFAEDQSVRSVLEKIENSGSAAEKKLDSIESSFLQHREFSLEIVNDSTDRIFKKIDEINTEIESNAAGRNGELLRSNQRAEEALLASKLTIDAYRRLASQHERLLDGAWSADNAISSLTKSIERNTNVSDLGGDIDAEQMREIGQREKSGRPAVRIGIASMKGREDGLKQVLARLIPQADEIFVYLNGMDMVPSMLPTATNLQYFTGKDFGDRSKFLFLEGFDGYYLTCDDDILYPEFYVEHIIDGIERYGRKAVVGWHGSIFSDDFDDYYNSKYRKVLSFSTLRGLDTPVHLLGTGVCGFHTSTINLKFDEFIHANMADVFVALNAQHNNIPMVVLRHERGWATPIEPDAPSISNVSLGKTSGNGLDVRATVSKLVRDHGTWNIHNCDASFDRAKFSVAVIGRTDIDRWKKGGILKSAHLTASSLRRFGTLVHLEDIQTGDPYGLGGVKPDCIMIYVGDPDRPDFSEVESLVHHHASMGRPIVINLSINEKISRYDSIVKKMKEWESVYGGLIRLMVFSMAMLEKPELSPIRNLLLVIPKTIELPPAPYSDFASGEGVFLGDVAKLSDPSLMDYSVHEWIAAIRRALPGVPLYAVRQYQPKFDVKLDIDVVWPFLKDDFSVKLSKMRLMFTPIKYATFEMVPTEVASLGLPVVYTPMPQSLSEYLGLSGIQVTSPSELEAILPDIYFDPTVWRSLSSAGFYKAKSQSVATTAGQMYLRLRQLTRPSL